MHRLDQRLDVPPLGFCAGQPALRVPRIPLILFALQLVGFDAGPGSRALHDAVDIAFHRLLVESIES